jgi:hypothetical protein
VVTIDKLYPKYDYWVAVCTMTNRSEYTLWFDGETRERPVYSVESKSHPYLEIEPMFPFNWGEFGADRYMLSPGQSVTFLVDRNRFEEPFRVGIWLSPEKDNKSFREQVYWSEIFFP